MAEHSPLIAYTATFVRPTRSPIRVAACWLPPTA